MRTSGLTAFKIPMVREGLGECPCAYIGDDLRSSKVLPLGWAQGHLRVQPAKHCDSHLAGKDRWKEHGKIAPASCDLPEALPGDGPVQHAPGRSAGGLESGIDQMSHLPRRWAVEWMLPLVWLSKRPAVS